MLISFEPIQLDRHKSFNSKYLALIESNWFFESLATPLYFIFFGFLIFFLLHQDCLHSCAVQDLSTLCRTQTCRSQSALAFQILWCIALQSLVNRLLVSWTGIVWTESLHLLNHLVVDLSVKNFKFFWS